MIDLDDELDWDFQDYSGATNFSGRIYWISDLDGGFFLIEKVDQF
jgi:hypothetical protein